LIVLLAVICIKEGLFRFVLREAISMESSAVHTDAWHHRSDAITSLAAAIGISVALLGGKGYESADEVAAIVAAGIIIWNFVSTLIMDVSNSMSNNASIISKVYFPKVILPVSTILVAFIDFLVSFVIFLIIYFSVKGLPSLPFLLLPFVLAFAVLVCFGLGLIFATASIKYRDAKFILPFLVQIFFYLTPVFISSSLVLNMHIPVILKDLYLINPFYYVVEGFKYCLNGHFNYFEPAHFFISVGITGLVLLVAMRYFYRVEKSFVDYL